MRSHSEKSRRFWTSRPATSSLEHLDRSQLPRHLAIIMDGNGRWAKARNLPRIAGHRAGVRAVRRTVEAVGRLGIEELTLYAFSTENWRRPAAEVSALMALLYRYVCDETDALRRQNVQLRILGRQEELPGQLRRSLQWAEKRTAESSGLRLNIAVNYSGRREIVDACRAVAREVAEGRLALDAVDEDQLAARLAPLRHQDVDLLIRTSGEYRVSNFLLWQMAYAEIYVTDVFWPDFGPADLARALEAYQTRERRFGMVSEQLGTQVTS